MADTDGQRRFLPHRPRSSDPAAASVAAHADARPGNWTPEARQQRLATAGARQDVVDVAAFIGKVETERSHGRRAPRPQPMQDVLDAFRGAPGMQITVQILAAAATARHFGGEQSATARTWERLAQDNAARLEAVRGRQYRQEQSRYVHAQMPPEQIQRRLAERATADQDADKRVFDAAGALALSYVAVKSLPPFDKLTELSREHLVADPVLEPAQTIGATPPPGRYPDGWLVGEMPDLDTSRLPELADAPADVETSEIDLDKEVPYGKENTAEALEDSDVSDELEQVSTQEGGGVQTNNRDLSKLGSVLETAGRGLATAMGPVSGDDDLAPPLPPVNLNQLSQDLLSALGAAMSSHPRSVTEMLNIEREPDPSNEIAFVPDTGIEHGQEAALGLP